MPFTSIARLQHVLKAANLALVGGLLVGCATAQVPARDPAPPQREPAWLSGEIMGVDRIPIDQYNDSTVHLMVATESPETVDLELGPGWYVDSQGLAFQPDQRIEYRGTPHAPGKFTVYEIRQGESSVQLRNERGEPRWQERKQP